MIGRTHLDSGTDGGLELDNGLSLVGDLELATSRTVHKQRLTLLLTMISRFKASSSMTFLIAFKLHPVCQFNSRESTRQLTNVVGVEDLVISFYHAQSEKAYLELPGGAELVQVVLGDLGDLKEPCLAVVINDGTTLDIGLGLVGDLHNVLGLRVDHGLHDVEINNGTQVVDVGNEDVFLSSGDELGEETRVAANQPFSRRKW